LFVKYVITLLIRRFPNRFYYQVEQFALMYGVIFLVKDSGSGGGGGCACGYFFV
jgi:hypothetical protein